MYHISSSAQYLLSYKFSPDTDALHPAPFPLILLFPGYPARFADKVFLPLKEGSSAPNTILRSYPLELGAIVTVRLAGSAAFDVMPFRTHMPLPVWLISKLISPNK